MAKMRVDRWIVADDHRDGLAAAAYKPVENGARIPPNNSETTTRKDARLSYGRYCCGFCHAHVYRVESRCMSSLPSIRASACSGCGKEGGVMTIAQSKDASDTLERELSESGKPPCKHSLTRELLSRKKS